MWHVRRQFAAAAPRAKLSRATPWQASWSSICRSSASRKRSTCPETTRIEQYSSSCESSACLRRRVVEALEYLDHLGTSNGPIETINGRLEQRCCIALGVRTVINYVATSHLKRRRIQRISTLRIAMSRFSAKRLPRRYVVPLGFSARAVWRLRLPDSRLRTRCSRPAMRPGSDRACHDARSPRPIRAAGASRGAKPAS